MVNPSPISLFQLIFFKKLYVFIFLSNQVLKCTHPPQCFLFLVHVMFYTLGTNKWTHNWFISPWTGSDNQVAIWNVGLGEVLVHIDCHPDIIYSACWNWDGSQLLTTCKDKKMRLINPRSGEIIEVITFTTLTYSQFHMP